MPQQRETVVIQDGGFDPRRFSIPVGTAVVWRNGDTTDHIASVQFHETAEDWHFRFQDHRVRVTRDTEDRELTTSSVEEV